MTRITINDIESTTGLDAAAMESTQGGLFYNPWALLMFNVFNPRINPIGYRIQQQTISMAGMFAQHNANWLTNFRNS